MEPGDPVVLEPISPTPGSPRDTIVEPDRKIRVPDVEHGTWRITSPAHPSYEKEITVPLSSPEGGGASAPVSSGYSVAYPYGYYAPFEEPMVYGAEENTIWNLPASGYEATARPNWYSWNESPLRTGEIFYLANLTAGQSYTFDITWDSTYPSDPVPGYATEVHYTIDILDFSYAPKNSGKLYYYMSWTPPTDPEAWHILGDPVRASVPYSPTIYNETTATVTRTFVPTTSGQYIIRIWCNSLFQNPSYSYPGIGYPVFEAASSEDNITITHNVF